MGRRKKRKPKKFTNAHHLLFQRKHWSSPKCQFLRRLFVYQVPIEQHNYLHKEVLHDVVVPRDLDNLYREASEQVFWLKHTGLRDGLLWLYGHSSDPLFKESISRQYEYFYQERPP